MGAADLRRRGAQLRAHQAQLAQLTSAVAEAEAGLRDVDARLRDAQTGLARADAEHRVADGRQTEQQRAVRRSHRAALDDDMDDLAAVRSSRSRPRS